MKYLDSAFAMALKIERESYYLDNSKKFFVISALTF